MLDLDDAPLTTDAEKGEVELAEVLPVLAAGLQSASIPPPPELTPEEEKRLWRKIDVRLVPIAVTLYLFSNLDRGNIGNAKLEGLITQLDLTGGRYNVALTMFYLSYSILNVPANLVIKKLRPSRWLPGITLAWGITAVLMGLVKTYPQFVGLRLCLGAAEAGLSPGIYYLLSLWYPRHMLQWRYGLFWGGATLSGAFSGLLAYGISFMAGKGGLLGWSWIFIIEGLLTVVVGTFAFMVFVDLPGTASFLTPEERSFVLHRLARDRPGGEEENFEWRHLHDAVLDWKVFMGCMANFSITCPLYGAQLFLPCADRHRLLLPLLMHRHIEKRSIINGLGFNAAISQLLSVPPYAIATATVITCSLYSDRIQARSPFIFGGLLFALIGFSINISDAPIGAKYFGMFLVVIGSNLCAPMGICWQGNNVVGHYKRGIGIGLQVMYGNVAGIVVSNIFRVEDAPRYLRGHLAELVLIGVGLVVVPTTAMTYMHLNRRRDAAERRAAEKATMMECTEEELRRLADHAPGFSSFLAAFVGMAHPSSSTQRKRPRIGSPDEEQDEKPFINHSTLYFDDGNVILGAGRTLFCVHRSLLAKHSLVLRDLFDHSKEQFRGVLYVRMEETAEEVEALLNMVYDGLSVLVLHLSSRVVFA
ncbi:hypothetical protein NUW54_g7150 [Trametes sanguinea]|uniref:Uncharacterized protein n=1 Tax=Trametes sanguinea TaxID=158606 RepID=A0ACC1PPW4_9APHY|nr:hypothetical protein NUW54_g7150 [Trametes sanguinea]